MTIKTIDQGHCLMSQSHSTKPVSMQNN